jgi:AraC-like DNA-binding protein
MPKIYACIWSNDKAAEMARFYKSIFKGTKIGKTAYWGSNPMGVKEGSVLTMQAAFLSSLLKLELIFRLLTGEHGHLFLQRALFDPRANGVAAAIAWIRRHPTSPLSVARLAKTHGLSVSALHHKFKAVTTLSPLQYQKQLRLQEARRLMLGGLANASTAALRVGYESPSQFSREYRRQFGRPPRADAEAVRQRGDETVE